MFYWNGHDKYYTSQHKYFVLNIFIFIYTLIMTPVIVK